VSENRVLRIIFGPKRDEVTGEWRKLHNEELNDLCSSPTIVRVIKWRSMRWVWHEARLGERRGVYRILVMTREGKRPCGKPKRKWEGDIKMDFKGIGGGDMDWIDLASDRNWWRTRVKEVMYLRVL